MANIEFMNNKVVVNGLDYSIKWYFPMGELSMDLCLFGHGQEFIQYFIASETSVNDVPCNNLSQMLTLLGSPELFEIPE
jgi:hypothetical protein